MYESILWEEFRAWREVERSFEWYSKKQKAEAREIANAILYELMQED